MRSHPNQNPKSHPNHSLKKGLWREIVVTTVLLVKKNDCGLMVAKEDDVVRPDGRGRQCRRSTRQGLIEENDNAGDGVGGVDEDRE